MAPSALWISVGVPLAVLLINFWLSGKREAEGAKHKDIVEMTERIRILEERLAQVEVKISPFWESIQRKLSGSL